jgi:hypothetical protein
MVTSHDYENIFMVISKDSEIAGFDSTMRTAPHSCIELSCELVNMTSDAFSDEISQVD